MVHISKEDQNNVFAMLAAVLWLGNVSFVIIDNEDHVDVLQDEGRSVPQNFESKHIVYFSEA